MGKIYTVGAETDNQSLINLGYDIIDFGHVKSDDNELHEFIMTSIKNLNVEKLIIEIAMDELKSLKLAYHIRLTLDKLRKISLIPILFVSEKSFKQIILTSGIWGQIFSTKGVGFASFQSANKEIDYLEGLRTIEYKAQFLDIINVRSDEAIGKHSIANQWGAFVMDKVANTFALLDVKDKFRSFDKLYFKYSDAFNFNYELLNTSANKVLGNIAVGKPNRINARGCRILLIDDEADKGWEYVLRKVFNTSNEDDFQVICEQVDGYDSLSKEARSKIEFGDFDLFLVDLRLNGAREEDVVAVREFSGTNVIERIKVNRGNQVIVFTASNKAWNIGPLLNSGADGYYIKESPEYRFSRRTSEANFNDFREKSEFFLSRRYLRKVFNSIGNTIRRIDDLRRDQRYSDSFLDEVSNLLDQSFEMHYNATEKKHYAFAYVTLYMIIERMNSEFVTSVGNSDNKEWMVAGEYLKNWGWDGTLRDYVDNGGRVVTNKPPEWRKLVGVWRQKFGVLSERDSIIKSAYRLIEMRNQFIHNDPGVDGKVFDARGYRELFDLVIGLLERL